MYNVLFLFELWFIFMCVCVCVISHFCITKNRKLHLHFGQNSTKYFGSSTPKYVNVLCLWQTRFSPPFHSNDIVPLPIRFLLSSVNVSPVHTNTNKTHVTNTIGYSSTCCIVNFYINLFNNPSKPVFFNLIIFRNSRSSSWVPLPSVSLFLFTIINSINHYPKAILVKSVGADHQLMNGCCLLY